MIDEKGQSDKYGAAVRHHVSEDADLFTEAATQGDVKRSAEAFLAVLDRISSVKTASLDGRSWEEVVDDFMTKTTSTEGEIDLRVKTEPTRNEIVYGYYQVEDKNHQRLGRLPRVSIPLLFWKNSGDYLDIKIGKMIMKILKISRNNYYDENRIRAGTGLDQIVCFEKPIEEFTVPRMVVKP